MCFFLHRLCFWKSEDDITEEFKDLALWDFSQLRVVMTDDGLSCASEEILDRLLPALRKNLDIVLCHPTEVNMNYINKFIKAISDSEIEFFLKKYNNEQECQFMAELAGNLELSALADRAKHWIADPCSFGAVRNKYMTDYNKIVRLCNSLLKQHDQMTSNNDSCTYDLNPRK